MLVKLSTRNSSVAGVRRQEWSTLGTTALGFVVGNVLFAGSSGLKAEGPPQRARILATLVIRKKPNMYLHVSYTIVTVLRNT